MLPPPQTLGFGDPWAASRGAAALPRHKSHAHTSVLLISTFSSLRGLVYPPPRSHFPSSLSPSWVPAVVDPSPSHHPGHRRRR